MITIVAQKQFRIIPFRSLNTIRDSDDLPWAEIFAQCRAGRYMHPKMRIDVYQNKPSKFQNLGEKGWI